MADRVRRPERHEEMLSDLEKKAIFKTYKDALLFAASLGFARGKRLSFSKSGEPIRLQVFNSEFNRTAMNTLAVAETSDPMYLGEDKEDEKVRIFEEYACGGLEILKNEIWDVKADWELALLNLVLQEEDTDTVLKDITGLAQS